jgi:hypothetical protein
VIPTTMLKSKFGEFPAIKYTTGIEVADVNGAPVVFDLQDQYAVTLPTGWKAGALHPDFLPIIERYGQPNPYIKGVFGYFLQTSADTIRVFGFDTSPEHLNDHSYVVMVFKVLTDAGSLGKAIDQLADEFIANQPAKDLVTFTYRSRAMESAFKIPTVILMNRITDPNNGKYEYSIIVLAKADKAYVQMICMTNNSDIDLSQEIAAAAAGIGNYTDTP